MMPTPLAATFRSALRACALALFALATTPRAQELDQSVLAMLRSADAAPVDQLYTVGQQLEDLAPANLDSFRNVLVKAAGNGTPQARFAAAVALRGLKSDDTYGKDLFELLKPVLAAKNETLQAMAMAMLGEARSFNTRILPDVRKAVETVCKDDLAAPRLRIEAALALWGVGSNEQRGTAKRTLEEFLQSSDRELRIRGALALAQTNIEGGPAWALLREIQGEATDFGRMARIYIAREEERRVLLADLAKVVQSSAQTPAAAGNKDEYAVLNELRRRIRAQHIQGSSFTDADLIEFAAKGMLAGLDPHSTYFTSDEFKRFFFDLNREYGGIGAFVNFDQDNDFSIVRPIYSGPAYRAGLRSGDKILEIDGWETAGNTTEAIISRLKGKPDSTVVLKWFRPGMQGAQTLSIVRQQISVPAVNWAMVPGSIGYIELINFSSNLSEELQVALDDLMGKGAKGIVLDVRNNTGGFLGQARDVVEKFVPGRKLVVYTEGPAEERRNYQTRDRATCRLPLAVLTNNLSASASEITAGALQDLKRAVVIGERTFGKGSVQNIMELATSPPEEHTDLNGDGIWQEGEQFIDRNNNGKYDPGSHIKLTVSKYYLPSGRCPHREFDKEGRIVDPNWGVMPDKVVELLDAKPEDAWKNAAVFALLKKGVFRDYVKKHLAEHDSLFRRLAEGDDGDPSRYPGFEAFYQSLDTKLSQDDVRRWVRYEVRDQVSDLRGAVYPGQRAMGDPQEDAQLQEAVRSLLQERGEDIRQVPEYRNVLKLKFDETASAPRK